MGRPINCVWNLTDEMEEQIAKRVEEFVPQDPLEVRDKRVLEMFIFEGMSCRQIAASGDPLIVSNSGKRLLRSDTSIAHIVYKHFPEAKGNRTPPKDHFLTNEDIEQRKMDGVSQNRTNCGWNLPNKLVADIAVKLSSFIPKNERERRDKRILELAFIHDMNPGQIRRLNDPMLISDGNRSRGKPLSHKYIYDICMKYFPEVAEYRKSKSPTNYRKRRNEYAKKRLDGKGIRKPQVCATCGERKGLEVHHVIPLVFGGTDEYFNLIPLCHDCHMKLHHAIYDAIGWGHK